MYEDGRLTVTPLLDHRWKYFKLEDVPAGGHLVTVQYDKTGSDMAAGRGFRYTRTADCRRDLILYRNLSPVFYNRK